MPPPADDDDDHQATPPPQQPRSSSRNVLRRRTNLFDALGNIQRNKLNYFRGEPSAFRKYVRPDDDDDDNECQEDDEVWEQQQQQQQEQPTANALCGLARQQQQQRVIDRRPRTTFTGAQTQLLEHEYGGSEYISRSRRLRLADQLQLNEAQIKIWFQNRRAKDKRIEKARKDGKLRRFALVTANMECEPATTSNCCSEEDDCALQEEYLLGGRQ